jgi:hypothetical protein
MNASTGSDTHVSTSAPKQATKKQNKPQNKKVVLDLVINGKLGIDVTIACPSAPHYLSKGQDKSQNSVEAFKANFAVNKAEQNKRSTWKHAIPTDGLKLYPFGMECYGSWGKGAIELIKNLQNQNLSGVEINKKAKYTISIALQKGNAEMMTSFAHAINTHAASGPNTSTKGAIEVLVSESDDEEENGSEDDEEDNEKSPQHVTTHSTSTTSTPDDTKSPSSVENEQPSQSPIPFSQEQETPKPDKWKRMVSEEQEDVEPQLNTTPVPQ